jgi:hypothetical protein
MNIEITNHPFFSGVKRKLEFNPLVIDYTAKTANWGFSIMHFDSEGNSISQHLPNVQGNFSITNDRKVDIKTGVKISPDADEKILNAGVAEFDFLSMALKQAGVDPIALGIARVKVSDARGNLNDYSALMHL